MPTIGKGVEKICVRSGDAYRIFDGAKFEEAVYILHAFQQKTQKTSRQDIELEKNRYRRMLQFRQQQMEESNDARAMVFEDPNGTRISDL